MKRRAARRTSPIVPRNMEKSQPVGEYIAHDDGRKSRCRLVTIITKALEPHAETTMIDMMKSTTRFVRKRLNQIIAAPARCKLSVTSKTRRRARHRL